jgi:hypothetical protein
MRRRGDSVMLVVDVPDDVAERFLSAEFPGQWREFCVPAEIVNRLPVRRLVTNP